jgi:hypothetical protein
MSWSDHLLKVYITMLPPFWGAQSGVNFENCYYSGTFVQIDLELFQSGKC